jgi:vancomycin permeability regulator SanA
LLKKTVKYLSLIFLCWLLVHSIVIMSDGLKDEGHHADYAVIFGNKVNTDGTLSERLEKRLECGLQLYQNKRVKGLIVSGGLGKEGFTAVSGASPRYFEWRDCYSLLREFFAFYSETF